MHNSFFQEKSIFGKLLLKSHNMMIFHKKSSQNIIQINPFLKKLFKKFAQKTYFSKTRASQIFNTSFS